MDEMNNEILFFIIALVLPHMFYRTILFTKERFFDKPILREKTGLKIHHMHYGMAILLAAVIFLLFAEKIFTSQQQLVWEWV
jgi:ABC-type Mn2+/Zn2+ transport system permease subunit